MKTITQFLNQIEIVKNHVFLLHGEDSFSINWVEKALVEKIKGTFKNTIQITPVYAQETSLGALLNLIQSNAMFDEIKLIIVKEAQDFSIFKKNVAKNDVNSFLQYLASSQHTNKLIISHKGKFVDRKTAVFKALSKNGAVFNAYNFKDYQLLDMISFILSEKQISAAPETIQLIIQHIGNKPEIIKKEIEKVITYIGDNKVIQAQDVHQCIGIDKEYNLFQLTKAISVNDKNKIVAIISYFNSVQQQIRFPMVLGMLVNYFYKVIKVMHYKDQKSDEQLSSLIDVNKYFIYDYKNALKHYSINNIYQIFKGLYRLDKLSKGLDSSIKTPIDDIYKELMIILLQNRTS